ncbi:MAG TPA: DUF4340 domain-containing protein, partial [Gemmataceae bacterium]|nr:DUF4340 domain-containing protein [Gemmataceae bacterium]
YARRAADPGVFAVKKEVRDALDRDSLAYRPLQLWQVLSDDIAKFTVEKGGSKYTLTRQGDDWRISGPFDAAAQKTPPEAMRTTLASVIADKCVAHRADDPAKYGLDKPYLRVGVTVREPAGPAKDHVLLVGKPAEGSPGARYAKLVDGEAVYVVPERVVSAVDRTALDLLERRLLTLDAKSLTEVSSQRGGDRLKLELKNGTWQVVEAPAAPFAADAAAADRLLGTLAGLRAERFAAYGPKLDLAKFGLDKPEVALTFAGKAPAAAKHRLALGKPVDGSPGERYARLDDGPGVVVLDAPTVADLTMTYLDFVDRTVLKFDAAAATAFFRKMGDDKLDIVKKDGGWQVTRPAALTADEKGMQELLDQLANLRAKRVAAYPAKDLKPFGLDESAAQVAVRLPAGDGKTQDRILKLGKVADEATGDRFALADGSRAVAVLPGALARRLTAAPAAFRDRNLARFPDADKILLERGPRKATFTKVDGTWKLTAPLTADADHDELDNFMNAVARLRADEIVADRPKDLKPYGLDKPEARWRFQSGDRDVLHLLIGGREKDGPRHYAKLADDGLVFLLDPSLTGRALAEYRSRKVWDSPPDAAQVETVRYGYASKPFVLEKGDAGWQVRGKPGVKVNESAVNDALAALSGLKAARYVVDKGADLKLYGLEPPELVLEVATRNGKKTIHVGRCEGDSKAYYARVPGKDRSEVFTISEADAGRIVRDLGQFTQK